ncbi:MAG: serpin family protein [Caldicoprobacteraceae bacterium]|mgnify:FL=1|jgi:serine protease inhibitor
MKIAARITVCLLSIVIVFMAVSCSSGEKPVEDLALSEEKVSNNSSGLPASAGEIDSRLVDANKIFGFKVFKQLIKQEPGKNIIISPTSISIALAMTYNGAEGETKDAMAGTLEVQNIDIDELNNSYTGLKTILQNPDPHVQISIANSLWMRKGTSFYEEFLNVNQEYYGAEVQGLDFESSEASKTINGWVKEQTKEKIDKIVDDNIDPDTILFLINALYFNGNWTHKFDPNLTREEPFFLGDGTEKSCSMMFRSTEEYPYFDGENFQAVNLPYGKERLSMILFLPDEGVNLQEFCQGITVEKWDEWMNSFVSTKGIIGLPKFKAEYEVELKETLKVLGMAEAFDEKKADFSKMHPIASLGEIYIDRVKHKTFVETNEEGTEAAGATVVEMKREGLPTDNFNMIINRPFFFAVRDNETDTILFMGIIENPEV